jgi:hypothetical protein
MRIAKEWIEGVGGKGSLPLNGEDGALAIGDDLLDATSDWFSSNGRTI